MLIKLTYQLCARPVTISMFAFPTVHKLSLDITDININIDEIMHNLHLFNSQFFRIFRYEYTFYLDDTLIKFVHDLQFSIFLMWENKLVNIQILTYTIHENNFKITGLEAHEITNLLIQKIVKICRELVHCNTEFNISEVNPHIVRTFHFSPVCILNWNTEMQLETQVVISTVVNIIHTGFGRLPILENNNLVYKSGPKMVRIPRLENNNIVYGSCPKIV